MFPGEPQHEGSDAYRAPENKAPQVCGPFRAPPLPVLGIIIVHVYPRGATAGSVPEIRLLLPSLRQGMRRYGCRGRVNGAAIAAVAATGIAVDINDRVVSAMENILVQRIRIVYMFAVHHTALPPRLVFIVVSIFP